MRASCRSTLPGLPLASARQVPPIGTCAAAGRPPPTATIAHRTIIDTLSKGPRVVARPGRTGRLVAQPLRRLQTVHHRIRPRPARRQARAELAAQRGQRFDPWLPAACRGQSLPRHRQQRRIRKQPDGIAQDRRLPTGPGLYLAGTIEPPGTVGAAGRQGENIDGLGFHSVSRGPHAPPLSAGLPRVSWRRTCSLYVRIIVPGSPRPSPKDSS
jgi:hypothetical protein